MEARTAVERPEEVWGGDKAMDLPSRGGPLVRRALIVDHQDLFRAVLAVVIERHASFADSVQAGTLAEARRALDGLRTRIDLAIVDLDLPGGAAFDLIREMRASEVPVLALTTDKGAGRRVLAREAGASEVITTTVPIRQIIEAARRLASVQGA